MKLKITLAIVGMLLFAACDNDDAAPKDTALFAVPQIQSLETLRSSISVEAPQETNSEGKIYVATGRLFYIAQEEGVHIFNNQDPSSPQNIAFLNIPGVHDIAVKDNFLYADNFIDLLVFDISNINNITLVKTVENVIQFYPQFPEEAEFYDYENYPEAGEMITGYALERRERPEGPELGMLIDATADFESSIASNSGGFGGSYAKFQLNENALYTIDSYQLNVFDISAPSETHYDKSVSMWMWINGGEFETLFKQKDFLFVGATSGMYIVNAEDEFNPYFVSGFSHATACDPVVVNNNTAYITVRGGNTCGAIEDQVNVIDIADVNNPTLSSTFLLDQPYGLGYRNNVLYVCCGSNGLKVFNAASSELALENTYNVNVTDVIPLSTHLIAVGDNKIIQYNYGANHTLTPISTINF